MHGLDALRLIIKSDAQVLRTRSDDGPEPSWIPPGVFDSRTSFCWHAVVVTDVLHAHAATPNAALTRPPIHRAASTDTALPICFFTSFALPTNS